MKDNALNLFFYCLAAIVGVLLFFWFKNADDTTLRLLLLPHAKLTEAYYGVDLFYIEGIGYMSRQGGYAIGRQCMGSSFVLMMFGMTSCMFMAYFKGIKKALWFITSLLLAVCAGVLTSSLRIIGSIPFAAHPEFAIIHSVIGISTYFLTLTASYYALNKLLGSDKIEKAI